MPAADLLAEAQAALEEGAAEEAGELFSAVLGTEPENPAAWGGLVRSLLALGQPEQAHAALEQVPAKIAQHAEIAGARSALALAEEGSRAIAELTGLQRRVEADPRRLRGALRPRHRAERNRRARAGCGRPVGDHPPRAGLERGRGKTTAAEVLRSLGPCRPGHAHGPAQALGIALQLVMDGWHPDLHELPAEIPVFPLAGALLLPHGKLPLNIFEPRYKAMVEDALADQRLFGMIQPAASALEGEDGPGLFGPRPVRCRLSRAPDLVQRDRRWPLPDRAHRADPLQGPGGAAGPAGIPPGRGRLLPLPTRPRAAARDVGAARALLSALRAYFTANGFDANWTAIEGMADDELVVTLCMVCPFDPLEKQASAGG